jgi:flagellar biosynthesis GTPase FlhF
MSNHKMRIMLLGPSGVGKTTLLAGLTKEMKAINESN